MGRFQSLITGAQMGLVDGLEAVRTGKRTFRMAVPFTERGRTGSGTDRTSADAIRGPALGM